ncbi:MAG: YitT family protein [Rikenellaceae bacterium]|nr:YitT family protein [Rikenellaceae bacterium]
MVKLSGKALRRAIREYIVITIGLFAYAFGWVAVIMPAEIVGGGVSGAALLIYYATGGEVGGGIPMAVSILVINGILLLLASFIIGFKFSTKTIYGVVVLSFAMGFLQQVIPPDLLGLSSDKLLSGILGGALAGIGISVCFSQGGSTGGTDIIAMMINKYRSVSYGRVLMTCDFLIIGLSYFIGNGISTVIYSYVLVAVMGYTVDTMVAGNKQSSQLFIISRNYHLIAEKIVGDANRGVTLLDGQGWYSKTPMKVLMVVCRKNETSTMFRIIKECDPNAFITVGSVMGVYGQGFDPLKAPKK